MNVIELTWKLLLVFCAISLGEWLVHRHLLHGAWVYRSVPGARFIYRWHHIEHHAQGRHDVRPHIDLSPLDYFPRWKASIRSFLVLVGRLGNAGRRSAKTRDDAPPPWPAEG